VTTFNAVLNRADGLLARLSVAQESQRITLEEEVTSLDFAVMKLMNQVRKNPLGPDANADFGLLDRKVSEINQLVYGHSKSDSLTKVALNAFSLGAASGAIAGVLGNSPAVPNQQATNANARKDPFDVATSVGSFKGAGGVQTCASKVRVIDLEKQRTQVEAAQAAFQQAEQLRIQAQGGTKEAGIQFLRNVDVQLLPPNATMNVGGAIADGPQLIQAQIQEGAANTQYNETLVKLGQEQAALARMERESRRQDPAEERGFWGSAWDFTKGLFGFVFTVTSKDF
jgi:hypothetical protein